MNIINMETAKTQVSILQEDFNVLQKMWERNSG